MAVDDSNMSMLRNIAGSAPVMIVSGVSATVRTFCTGLVVPCHPIGSGSSGIRSFIHPGSTAFSAYVS